MRKFTKCSVDKHIGERIRTKRSLMGLSKKHVAKELNISYQQLHKYENGMNRISASRLYDMTLIIGAPINYFYEGLPAAKKTLKETSDMISDMGQKEIITLIRSYSLIANQNIRKRLHQLINTLGVT